MKVSVKFPNTLYFYVDFNCIFSILFNRGGTWLPINDELSDDGEEFELPQKPKRPKNTKMVTMHQTRPHSNSVCEPKECRPSHQSKHTNMVAIHQTRSHSNDLYEPIGELIELQSF